MKAINRLGVEGTLSSNPVDPKNHCESNDNELGDISVNEAKGLPRSFQTSDKQRHDANQVQSENECISLNRCL